MQNDTFGYSILKPLFPYFYFKQLGFRYTQSATFPKDIVILLDTSGSMKGKRMSIARQAVKAMLSMLSDNDFFNVLTVSS